MVKILFTHTNCSLNKGSAAQVISTCETLRNLIPNLDITLMSHYPDLDPKLCGKHNIKVLNSIWLPINRVPNYFTQMPLNFLLAFLFKMGLDPKLLPHPIIQEYLSSDLILDLSGDSFGDSKGGISIYTDSNILFALSLKKPVAIYSQSIGPFKIMPFLSKYCLNHSDLLIVREDITRNFLIKLGIKVPIYLTADCAFLLNSSSCERIRDIFLKEGICDIIKPLVGISANSMFDDKNGRYAQTIAKFIDYIVEQYKVHVLFIPHVISRRIGGKRDDRTIGMKIYELAKNKENIKIINGDYSPEDLKGIIATCDIFLGGRMHANIASISRCVPTISTAWSHKYYGIMQTMGLEKYVCNYKTMTFEELKFKFDDLWYNRELIRNDLSVLVEEQKRLALYSADLVKDLIEKNDISSHS